jgi:hypothetical protein
MKPKERPFLWVKLDTGEVPPENGEVIPDTGKATNDILYVITSCKMPSGKASPEKLSI